ncbi:SWIM zinc finger family protein [Leptolyngbya ohadii]|uniref:SWIM zinc finger family protein n=1 Tax=Leptolyngbya ohadii TaxID=1962290 RepID=UPI000B59CAEB|nr:SWIM zinc finger family protein [Leptolyngbya ohadii]
MTLPISESAIRSHSIESSFSRGESYYEQGAVADLVQRGNTIFAEVEGSEFTPYQVRLTFDAAGITAAHCTCPYDYEGWCKHLVAVALACVRQPDSLEKRPTLAQLLDRLDQGQMRQLVQELVEQQPDLMERVDRVVLRLANPVPPVQQGKTRRSAVNAAPYRRQVKHILREGVRYLEEGYEDDPFSEELETIINKAEEFSREGDGNSAIAILQEITGACADEWDDLAEYGGDSFPITEMLDEAWAEAILSAELSPAEVIDLGVMLEEWQEILDGDFSMSLAALDQGWTDPQIQRVLQGKGYSDPARLEASYGQKLALIRLQILDRQERQQEYLNLANAEDLMQPYLTRLAELGRIEEAVTTARSRMTTAEEAFSLAKALRSQNQFAEALSIAQAGLPLPGHCRYDLAIWTSELAENLEQPDIAQTASMTAFSVKPNFADYQRVRQFAEDWDSTRFDLLYTLRQSHGWDAQEAKVDIFLHEGLIEDAIQAVHGETYRSELVHRVMEAAISTHPDWVIEAACQRADAIMDRGKADRYDEAVKWLKQAKAAYLAAGQKAAWEAYFDRLRSFHGRKYKLMDLFKQL